MGKNVGKSRRQNLISEYSQKLLDHAQQYATDALETISERAIQKTAKATSGFIGNKIPDKITRVSKSSPKIIQIKKKQMKEKYLEKDIYISRTQTQNHA